MNIFREVINILASRLFQRPFYVHIYPTRRCNLKCRMCQVWKYGNMEEELTLELWRHIIDFLKKEGTGHVVITGGEPLLYENIYDLVKYIADSGIDVRLQTNAAAHVTEEKLYALAEAGLKHITVSLDSLDQRVHDDICLCPGLYDRVLRVIERAPAIYKSGMVVVNTAVSNRNLTELPDIVRFATEKGAYSSLVPLHIAASDKELIRGGNEMFDNIPPTDVDRIYEEIFSMKKKGYHIAQSDRYLEACRLYLKTGEFSWVCDAGELYFSIFPDGGISICDDFPAEHNILDGDFSFDDFRKWGEKKRMECLGCVWGCWREASCLVKKIDTLFDRGWTYMKWKRTK